jgi:hypothetical protein
VLASAALAAVCVLNPFRRMTRRWRVQAARLLVLFALAFVVTWSAFDFWAYLPKLYRFVLSSYRILMFVCLFGALLAPYALATVFRRPMRPWQVVAGLTLLGIASLSYVPRPSGMPYRAPAGAADAADMGAYRDYMLTPPAVARTSWFHPDVNWAYPLHGLVRDIRAQQPTYRLMPVPQAGGTMRLEGVTTAAAHAPADSPVEIRVTLAGRALPPVTRAGPAGTFSATLPLPGPFDEPVVPFELGARRPDGTDVSGEVTITVLRYAAAGPPPAERYVAGEGRARNTRRGRRVRYEGAADRPTLVQLPVLYYPGLLSVRDRQTGRPIPYGNIGRLVAVRLPPGRHRIEVTFVGVRWANVVSASAWAFVLAGAVWLAWRHVAARRRRRRRTPSTCPSRDAGVPRGELGPVTVAAGSVMLLALLGAATLYRSGRLRPAHPPGSFVTASREADPDHSAAMAFDGDDATDWIAGGGGPATLTVVPTAPRAFRRLTLTSRVTGLYECWHRVRVELFLDGARVAEQEAHLPDAGRLPAQSVDLPDQTADRVVIHFSDPVLVTRDGQTRVGSGATNPGYREIRLE